MSNAGYSVTNMAAASTSTLTVSGSADSANYPTTNLTDSAPAPRWRASAKTGVWIKVNLGSAQTVKFAALLNHNLTTGATVTLEGHASDSWGAPSYSASMTWRSPHIFLVLSQSYQWWRITITDSGNTYFPSVGEFYIGSLVTFTTNVDFPQRGKSYCNTRADFPSGQIAAVNISNLKNYTLAWGYASSTTLAEIQALHDACQGAVLPVCFLPDTASTELIYGKLSDDLTWTEAFNSAGMGLALMLSELPNGVNL